MRSLLVTCMLIGLAAVAAPHFIKQYLHGSGSGSGAAEASFVPDGSADSSDGEASSGPRQLHIEAGRDGHFYVDAEINGGSVRLMVDTGATTVALRVSDAASAGIRVIPGDFTKPVQTANGTTMAAETTLQSVAVEDIEVAAVRALIIPDDQLSVSLLGASFLNGLERFEVAGGTLIFEN